MFLLAPKRKRETQSGDTEEVPAASTSVTQESCDGSTIVPEPATRNAEVALVEQPGPIAEEIRTVPEHSGSGYVEDVGSLIEQSKGDDEQLINRVQSMSAPEKYFLLKNHSCPADDYDFPKRFCGGCNRTFRVEWLKHHPWLVYSLKLDGAFCLPCVLFNGKSASANISGVLVTKPFTAWQKKSEKFSEHEKTKYHQASLELSDVLIRSVEHPEMSLPAMINTKRALNITQNRAVLKSIARAVQFCGKQCIGLRGDDEHLDMPGNPGNFLALLKLISVTDDVLRKHFESPVMRCVTHMSPQTQNELIEVMGKHIILHNIISELKEARFFSILADEVTSHNVEHLALCARFVDCENNIREEFLASLPWRG